MYGGRGILSTQLCEQLKQALSPPLQAREQIVPQTGVMQALYSILPQLKRNTHSGLMASVLSMSYPQVLKAL